MIEYLSFTKNLNKRKTSYILSLLKRIDFLIVIQSDLDYLMAQLQKLKVSVDELKTLKKIMDNFLVSDEVIYGDNSLPYKIFCYNMATRFYSYNNMALIRNALPDFFDDLVLDIDTSYNVMYLQPFMSTRPLLRHIMLGKCLQTTKVMHRLLHLHFKCRYRHNIQRHNHLYPQTWMA